MKGLQEHRISMLNESINIVADERDEVTGASHHYQVIVSGTYPSEGVVVDLPFQKGPLVEGINGISDQALLAVVLDRLRGFQSGSFPDRDNAIVITKLEEALDRMARRYRDRAARGVEGKYEK